MVPEPALGTEENVAGLYVPDRCRNSRICFKSRGHVVTADDDMFEELQDKAGTIAAAFRHFIWYHHVPSIHLRKSK